MLSLSWKPIETATHTSPPRAQHRAWHPVGASEHGFQKEVLFPPVCPWRGSAERTLCQLHSTPPSRCVALWRRQSREQESCSEKAEVAMQNSPCVPPPLPHHLPLLPHCPLTLGTSLSPSCQLASGSKDFRLKAQSPEGTRSKPM